MNSPTERQTRNTRKGKDFMVASGFSGTEFNERAHACMEWVCKREEIGICLRVGK